MMRFSPRSEEKEGRERGKEGKINGRGKMGERRGNLRDE